jgi:L-rhamnose mutarotase
MMQKYKRYCKTLKLLNDPQLIQEYKDLHKKGAVWPEVTEGMKKMGILDMEIYLSGTTLFMIMETKPDFDHDRALSKLAELPRQKEWEAAVSKYQRTAPGSSAKEKWKLMEQIFKMD